MATFYYREAPDTDGDWNSLGNWWMSYNAGTDTLSVPATSLPGANDDVVILAVGTNAWAIGCWVNSGPTPTVRNVTVLTGTLSIPLTATGTIRLYNNSILLGDPGDWSKWPLGTITGNIEMHDTTYIASGNTPYIAIVGNFSLYDYAAFTGIDITGNATFYDESYLAFNCNFSGDVVFNDDSRLGSGAWGSGGTILSANSVTFNDQSEHNGGIGAGVYPPIPVTFNDDSRLDSADSFPVTVEAPVLFTGNSVWVSGNVDPGVYPVTFSGTAHTLLGTGGYAVFLEGSYNLGTLFGDNFFRDSSYNNGIVGEYATVTFEQRTTYPIPRGINGSNILGVI